MISLSSNGYAGRLVTTEQPWAESMKVYTPQCDPPTAAHGMGDLYAISSLYTEAPFVRPPNRELRRDVGTKSERTSSFPGPLRNRRVYYQTDTKRSIAANPQEWANAGRTPNVLCDEA